MHPVILIGVFLFLILAVLLARYAPSPSVTRARLARGTRGSGELPSMRPAQLRSLAVDLLRAMGFADVDSRFGDERRLMAVRRAPFGDVRYVVFLEPEPPGDVVEQPTVLSLAEVVKSEDAQTGLLITPFAIERSGLGGMEINVEMIDGPRLRALVSEFLPGRLAELDGFRGMRDMPGGTGGTGGRRDALTPEPSL